MKHIVKFNNSKQKWEKITYTSCLYDICNYFKNGSALLKKLLDGEINEISNGKYIYKIIEDEFNYKIIVSIDYPSDLSFNEFKKFLENYENWNDDKILIDKKLIKFIQDKCEFEFLHIENEDGEKLNIWR